ncbi:SDR family NAD(P)-dependent oxidoreductase [Nonomuraea sp. NPDC048826]|uniref:SDR family NAD(P)-dependent oxidoreductase n=1 Tax=Nonomuraea sp. NPDC048826 TaxID=3364347 RepID=UPI0037231E0A
MQDKIVLITGGSAGIGYAVARAFKEEGATVVITGRDEGRLADAAKRLDADWVAADVASAADCARMVDYTADRHGGLHVAVNNAGVLGRPGPLADLDTADWADVLDTNLTGVFHAMKYEIAYMKEHGGGSIVNVASNIGAHQRVPGLAAYAASKAAVSVLSRAAAREYAAAGIRINAVSPGATDTTMTYLPGETAAERDARITPSMPLGRLADSAEVAATVVWLASGRSSFVVGHDLVVDGAASA